MTVLGSMDRLDRCMRQMRDALEDLRDENFGDQWTDVRQNAFRLAERPKLSEVQVVELATLLADTNFNRIALYKWLDEVTR